jgi:hypothetical protein
LTERVSLPRHLFAVSAAIGLFVPFLARLPGVPLRGWDWFTDYFPGLNGTLFFCAFNLVPAAALFGLGKASRRAPLAFWFALATLVAFLLWTHGSFNLRSSSTAAIGLMFIPIYAVAAVVGGWVLGWPVHAIAKNEHARAWIAGIAIIVAIAGGVATSVHESASIAGREARFPVIAVSEIPLTKRVVHACCSVGRVEALALGNFDTVPGNDLAVLGARGLAVLDPATYAVKSTMPFEHQDCENCVHMYPYLVPHGKGDVLVATSDGLSDSRGQLLWGTRATGFSKTVPVQTSQGAPTFLAYHNNDRIDLHDIEGKVLWSARLPVESVEVYVSADRKQMPSAITGYRSERRLRVYDVSGEERSTIPLPAWAMEVHSVSWPESGNLLVGAGSGIAVLDSNGREILHHEIQGTSFNPYHGPDGTAVRFRAGEGPYLAVASHGSSGYARSVLLVFDPKGHLVWQEETNKMRSILAVPRVAGNGEVLLVGGMEGVVEYSLAAASPPDSPAEPDARKSGARGAP